MRKELNTAKKIFPMPVLMIATYNDDGTVDVMNAAWGTMLDAGMVALNISAGHRTTKNILRRKAFTVSFADAAHVVEADYFGIASGNSTPDKFKRSGLTAEKAGAVDAPVILEFPVCLECEYVTYEDGPYGIGLIGRIVRVTAEESVLTDGKLDVGKCGAIAFDPFGSGYYKIGERVGNAYSDGRKFLG